ncbi:BtrH N-terminal domain-containing protein [Paenibacillus tarimensis]|uniref:BtrH N-terminal domain-containing protein n=1 Tax=Paenibacillus tarimensis TaxID=416012 RepID=UPI001F42A90E|nr:BtrH N-terminal domain-containing protein [Paenibacillus tarimensis]MCF2945520.1 BtrH N-terminal domain-containing protein [Paenibacillus tarimensis]
MGKHGTTIDIEPVKDIKNNCLEDVLITFCNLVSRDHQMMFLDLREIGFEEFSEEKQTVGRRVTTPYITYRMQLLEQFHGIQVTYHDRDFTGFLDIADEELAKNRPLLAYIDTYWLPWHAYYQRISSTHVILINGINHDAQELVCTDPFYLKKNQTVTYESFDKGGSTFCTFSVKEYPTYTVTEILDFIEDQLTQYMDSKSFDALRKLADHATTLNLQLEGENGTLTLLNVPLFIQLRNIFKSKYNYARALEYIHAKTGLSHLSSFSQELYTVGAKWETIRGILMKLYAKTDHSPGLLANVSERMKYAIHYEQELIQRCLKYLREQRDTLEISTHSAKQASVYIDSAKKTHLDLSKVFNNRGISSVRSKPVDLTGWGQFIYIKEPVPPVLHLREENYEFALSVQGEFDNIANNGERIIVPEIQGRYLTILGCSDNGIVEEEMIVEYKSGQQEKVRVYFSNWMDRPSHQETVAITGVVGRRRITNYPDQTVSLFASRYVLQSVKPIVKIYLPLCPVIHIFAITIEA